MRVFKGGIPGIYAENQQLMFAGPIIHWRPWLQIFQPVRMLFQMKKWELGFLLWLYLLISVMAHIELELVKNLQEKPARETKFFQ